MRKLQVEQTEKKKLKIMKMKNKSNYLVLEREFGGRHVSPMPLRAYAY